MEGSSSGPALLELVGVENLAGQGPGGLPGEIDKGRTQRFGRRGLAEPLAASSGRAATAASVRTIPGLRALTAIPYGFSSSAMK